MNATNTEKILSTDPTKGLQQHEVESQRKEFGYNEVLAKRKSPRIFDGSDNLRVNETTGSNVVVLEYQVHGLSKDNVRSIFKRTEELIAKVN